MDVSALDAQLSEDTAREVPPFGAPSVRLAASLGTQATALLQHHIHANDDTALLALEALRASNLAVYDALPADERAAVYVGALHHATFYNAWGLPGYHLTDTARALIALGETALPLLQPLLTDTSPAPLSGSQDATTSAMYENRVCDYAWVLISEMLTLDYTYHQDSAERDREIAALQDRLP